MIRGSKCFLASVFALHLLLLPASALCDEPAMAPSEVQKDPGAEYIRLRAVNAVLKARLSLAKEPDPYLILDIPEREVRLELQGVPLARVPVRKVVLNDLAREISRDTTRIAFCELPFVLKTERWFEPIPTLASKDSAAVMSQPDTTGVLLQRMKTVPILSVSRFERNLAVAMNGFVPSPSSWERFKERIRGFVRSFKEGTPESAIRMVRKENILVELEMEPLEVRSFAPNVKEGTKLVLRF